MKIIKGLAAAPGLAIAQVFKIEEQDLKIEKKTIKDSASEIKKLDKSLDKASKDLQDLYDKTKAKLGASKAEIFLAHQQILNDPVMVKEIKDLITNNLVNSEYATSHIGTKYHDLFANMEDEYMKERASDVKDVINRLLHYLMDKPLLDLASIKEDRIIVCEDLTPSQTANLNEYAKGFVTEIGGVTSHSAIMANSLELPAIVAAKSILKEAKNNQKIIIDGSKGEVILDPDQKTLSQYQQKIVDNVAEKKALQKFLHQKSITSDGHQIKIEANIGSVNDAIIAVSKGAEGVGLFRSEFLYMNSDNWPDEQTQFEAYKKVLQTFKDKGVVIRTLDIGGDKTLNYFKFPHELNPFLGYRAIRLTLDQKDIFKTQLRALLRASAYGNLKIMFPLIATIEEFKQASKMLVDVKKELEAKKVKIGNYEVGMMMEIPIAAIIADKFAMISDFFSIGTNDLLQYSFAADRMNEKVSYLYQPLHPGNLRMINNIIHQAHLQKKWVGMCGAMAGDELALPLLIGMGLDDFSMSANLVLKARQITQSLSFKECQKLAEKALNCQSESEVITLVKNFLEKK